MQTEANPAAGTATAAQKSPQSAPPLRGWPFPVSRSRPVHLQCKGHHPRCQHVGNVASDVITPIKAPVAQAVEKEEGMSGVDWLCLDEIPQYPAETVNRYFEFLVAGGCPCGWDFVHSRPFDEVEGATVQGVSV